MSTYRKLTTNEIQAVGSILQDKEAIDLLKKINEQVVTEEDTKGKRKQNDIFAFQGFAHGDDILGEDPESKEFQQKQGSIKKLVDTGLILEGFHVPLERHNEKKFGDLNIPATQNKVAKFKITEEGLTLLALVGSGQQQKQQVQQSNNVVPDDSKQKQKQATTATTTKNSNKAKAMQSFKQDIKHKSEAIASFKEDIKKENKL